jgi:outer membrane protein OmpA-like peptidoglycan-associated protein
MTQNHRGVYFTARRTSESEKSGDGTAYEQVMTTNMDDFDDWDKDAVLDGYGVGTDHDATVQLMNNDSTIVTYKNEDLFMSDLQPDSSWGNRRRIGNINTSKWDSHVYLYNAGNTMIYAFAANSNNGKLDLYILHKDASGNWERGTAIDELNTDENDDAPYVAGDGTLYFASEGHESIGGYDIFQSTYDSTTNKFSTPENLGTPINSVNDDTFFSVYGKMAYFASARRNGYGSMDIYKVYLFKKTVVAGRFFSCDDRTPIVGATVSVEGQEDEFSTITDINGFYKMELPIEADFMLNVVKAGANLYKQKHFVKILFRDENDVGRDFLVGCPNPEGSDERIIIKLRNAFDLDPSAIMVEAPIVIAAIPEPESVTEVIEVVEEVKEEAPVVVAAPVITALPALEIELLIVYFDFDLYNIQGEFHQRLNEAAELLIDRTDLRVFVGGHTDNYGTDDYNVALGQRRYDAVYNYLVDKGVDPSQLETGTYGEGVPAQNNRTRQGRALNRRVMLSFID